MCAGTFLIKVAAFFSAHLRDFGIQQLRQFSEFGSDVSNSNGAVVRGAVRFPLVTKRRAPRKNLQRELVLPISKIGLNTPLSCTVSHDYRILSVVRCPKLHYAGVFCKVTGPSKPDG